MSNSGNSSPEIDKEHLYGEHMARTRWMDKLFKRGCHKALDIPVDDMNFQQHQGISGKHLLGIVMVLLAGLLGWRGIDRLSMPPVEPPAPAPAAAVPLAEPQEFRVTFRQADDGSEIEIEPEGATE